MHFEKKIIMNPKPSCFCCKVALDISRHSPNKDVIYFDKRFYHKDCFVKMQNKQVKQKCYFCKKQPVMKKTLIDVSKKTGYSISTISRVLNGKSEKYRISQSAKEAVSYTHLTLPTTPYV